MKHKSIILGIVLSFFAFSESKAFYVKILTRDAVGGGPHGYNSVSENRVWGGALIPVGGVLVPIVIRYVDIDCNGPGFESCPASLVVQAPNDPPVLDANAGTFLMNYASLAISGGSTGGSHTTTIYNGTESGTYKVDWNVNALGEQTIEVYKWFAEVSSGE
ncbi:MAG: hypothetical protein V4658_13665 [Bacteroidota bacterium]